MQPYLGKELSYSIRKPFSPYGRRISIQTKTVRIAVNIENLFFIAVSALKSSFVSPIKDKSPLYVSLEKYVRLKKRNYHVRNTCTVL